MKKRLKYYDEVLTAKPDDFDVKYNKALVIHAMNKYSDAIALYNELLSVKDSQDIQNNLTAAYVALGDEYLKAHNYSLATEMFEKAVDRNTNDSYAYFGLAQSYRACGINDRATEYFEKAISMAPDKMEYSTAFAEFISATSKPDIKISADSSSQGITEIVLTMDSSADEAKQIKDLILKGDENYKNKNYNKSAISFYKKAIVVNPNYTDGWFNLGLVYANDKNNNKAKECFHRVITLNPNYGYAYYALGLAYEQDGNKKEALNNYKIFLVHNKDEATGKAVQEKIKKLENE